MSTLHITFDTDEIRDWAEKKNGFPVIVEGAKPEDALSFIFEGETPKFKNYKRISWEKFSEKMDNSLLAIQFEDSDSTEHQYKFVSRSNN